MSDDQNQEEQAPVEDAEAGQDSGYDDGGAGVKDTACSASPPGAE